MNILGYMQSILYLIMNALLYPVMGLLIVLFILMLPFEIPGWLLLLMAFFTGFVMDLFEHTYGIHTSATLLMAWFRPGVLKLIAPQDGYVPNSEPMIRNYGFSWFMKYSVILVFFHHAILFYFEVFTFHHFFTTLFRVFISSFFTIRHPLLSGLFRFLCLFNQLFADRLRNLCKLGKFHGELRLSLG